MFNLTQTDDYEELKAFFIENELEFSEEDPVPMDIVKCWKLTDEDGAAPKLIGGAVLAKREEDFVLDGIAVDAEYRMRGLGKELLDKVIQEIRERSGNSLYLVARVPGFYYALGFKRIPKEEAPDIIDCLTCPQFEVSCHPEVMKLDI